MLSPRCWLEQNPRQLRLFVALLTLFSFVAPTWHICSLGGHASSMSAPHAMGNMAHGETFERSASGAVICFCPPHERDEKFPVETAFQLNARMTHDASCLALLLGSMPALLASPLGDFSLSRLSFALWFPALREFPARELIRTFSSRGPPR